LRRPATVVGREEASIETGGSSEIDEEGRRLRANDRIRIARRRKGDAGNDVSGSDGAEPELSRVAAEGIERTE